MNAVSRLTTVSVAILLGFGARSATDSGSRLRLIETIPLAGVEGRIDHLAIDLEHRRLFVCALGNDSLEVIDLNRGLRIRSITGLGRPQGVSYAGESNRLVVSSEQHGTCQIYDGTSLQEVGRIRLDDDADNLRYDVASGHLYAGFGNGGLAVIDPLGIKQVRSVMLGAHPEAFALEKHGKRVFVNLPGNREVAVVDREAGTVVLRWKTDTASGNFPIAIDEAEQRLFVGCRNPSVVIVLDTASGRVAAKMDIAGDVDDLFYDEKRGRIYAICGAGVIDVLGQLGPDSYRLLERIPTAPGARTGLFVPESDELFVAFPRRGSRTAEVCAYRVE